MFDTFYCGVSCQISKYTLRMSVAVSDNVDCTTHPVQDSTYLIHFFGYVVPLAKICIS